MVVPLSGPTPADALLSFTVPTSDALLPRHSYSLRLVVGRKLYDEGTAVHHSPAMTNLPVGGALRLNRYDFDRLGVAEGDLVRVIAPALTIEAPVVVDPAVPRGSAGAWFNQDGLCAADLIDITAPLTVLQVESLNGQGAGS